jgi:histidine triad (HIT) family protein
MSSVFSKIVSGDIPCYKIAENDEFLAFLDLRPLRKGHTLVIPKVEIDYFFDVPDDLLGRHMQFAKKVAGAIEKVIECKRIGVSVIGLEIPHAHIHLIPIDSVTDMDFTRMPLDLSAEEMQAISESIGEVMEY